MYDSLAKMRGSLQLAPTVPELKGFLGRAATTGSGSQGTLKWTSQAKSAAFFKGLAVGAVSKRFGRVGGSLPAADIKVSTNKV